MHTTQLRERRSGNHHKQPRTRVGLLLLCREQEEIAAYLQRRPEQDERGIHSKVWPRVCQLTISTVVHSGETVLNALIREAQAKLDERAVSAIQPRIAGMGIPGMRIYSNGPDIGCSLLVSQEMMGLVSSKTGSIELVRITHRDMPRLREPSEAERSVPSPATDEIVVMRSVIPVLCEAFKIHQARPLAAA